MADQDPKIDTSTPEGRAAVNAAHASIAPSMVPAKFKNADGSMNQEALVKSYLELEQKQSGIQKDISTTTEGTLQDIARAATQPSEGAEDMAALLRDEPTTTTKDDVDWDVVKEELAVSGNLSKETLEKVKAAGIPDALIQSAVQGYQAQQREAFNKASELVGGKDVLTKVLNWVKTEIAAEERAELIKALRGPAGEAVLIGLHQQWVKKTKQPVDTSRGGVTAAMSVANDVRPYANQQEMQRDIRDPRYNVDHDYSMRVAARIGASHGIAPERYLGKA